MEAVIGGFIGFVAAFAVFAMGFAVGRRIAQQSHNEQKVNKTQVIGDEIARIKRSRETLEAEQRAFRDLCGYNADIAYGVSQFPMDGE